MDTTIKEINELQTVSAELEAKIVQEAAELEVLKNNALEVKIRRIALEEVLGRY